MKIYKILINTAIFVIISFVLVYFYLTSSGSERPSNTVVSKRILLVSQVYQNPYWQIVKKGAEDAAMNRGCAIEYAGPQTPSINESLNIINMGIATSIDGIITYVQEEKKYIPLINKASRNGISVITIDADSKDSQRIAYVGTNNIRAGYAAGKQLADITKSKSYIGIIMAGETTASEIERVRGFKEYIADNNGMKIISVEASNSDIIQAEIVAKKMIQKFPKLNAIYCTGSVDGIGAARAVMNTHNKEKIKIVCFDNLPETIKLIEEDVIQASIVQKPYQMGYYSVSLMMDKLEGKEITKEYLTGIVVVTKSNLDTYNKEKGEINGRSKALNIVF
jgi:ribose transport system substrate-binding protein